MTNEVSDGKLLLNFDKPKERESVCVCVCGCVCVCLCESLLVFLCDKKVFVCVREYMWK
jgi:hypothetical protein